MARLYGPGPEAPPALVSTADLAGLATRDVDDRPVGELVGTLSEERNGLIRYLDVAIRQASRHVLVPIGHARFDRSSATPRVRLRAATHDDLLSVPGFDEETVLDSNYHERVMRSHGRFFYGSRYYAHPAYDHAHLRVSEQPVEPEEGADAVGLVRATEQGGSPHRRLRPLLGLPTVDEDGEATGELVDFIVDARTGRERYAILRLDSPSRDALVPVGYVDADPESGRASTPALSGEDIRLLPAYDPPITRETENRIQAVIEARLEGPRYFRRADFRSPGT